MSYDPFLYRPDYDNGGVRFTPPQTVDQAEAALKRARAHEKAQRKAAKQAARALARRLELHKLGMKTLRAVANDDRKGSARARLAAANRLLELGR